MKKKEIYTIVLLISFFIVLTVFIKIPATEQIDEHITDSIYNSLNNNFVTQFLLIITNYTFGTVYGAIAAAIFLVYKKAYKLAVAFLAGGLISFIIVGMLKSAIGRERPFDLSNGIQYLSSHLPHELSFPSGHTTLAFFIAYFLTKGLKLNKLHSTLVYMLAVLVALSRVYLGAHYFLDVMAGTLCGTLIGIISIYVFNKYVDMKPLNH